jgi:hypothetical protein
MMLGELHNSSFSSHLYAGGRVRTCVGTKPLAPEASSFDLSDTPAMSIRT